MRTSRPSASLIWRWRHRLTLLFAGLFVAVGGAFASTERGDAALRGIRNGLATYERTKGTDVGSLQVGKSGYVTAAEARISKDGRLFIRSAASVSPQRVHRSDIYVEHGPAGIRAILPRGAFLTYDSRNEPREGFTAVPIVDDDALLTGERVAANQILLYAGDMDPAALGGTRRAAILEDLFKVGGPQGAAIYVPDNAITYPDKATLEASGHAAGKTVVEITRVFDGFRLDVDRHVDYRALKRGGSAAGRWLYPVTQLFVDGQLQPNYVPPGGQLEAQQLPALQAHLTL